MKRIGFLSFGHWSDSPHSQVRSGSDALLQSIELAVAAEELGADGAYLRVHHFARQLASPFPLLAAVGARTARIEIGTAVIDMQAATSTAIAEFQRTRARDGLSISYAAFDEGGPICVGTHQPVGDVTEIVGVATLPAARQRGLAVALTSALVADARTRGVETVFLSAGSEDVARIYERVGFRRTGSAGAAELFTSASQQ